MLVAGGHPALISVVEKLPAAKQNLALFQMDEKEVGGRGVGNQMLIAANKKIILIVIINEGFSLATFQTLNLEKSKLQANRTLH